MLVIDSTALLELLLNTPIAAQVRDKIIAADKKDDEIGVLPHELVAPQILDLEVVEMLHRYHVNSEISAERAREALRDLRKLPIGRYGHDHLLERIWELRGEEKSTRAVTYLALAESLDVPILTSDPRMAAMSGHRARVVAVGEQYHDR